MEYNIVLTEQELMVVINALGERPLKEAINAFSTIQRQAAEQASKEEVK